MGYLARAPAPLGLRQLVPRCLRMPIQTPTDAPSARRLAASSICSPHRERRPSFVLAVMAGQTLCVIEAMKVFNEIVAERDGCVDAFLVDSGHEVDAGQPLLRWV